MSVTECQSGLVAADLQEIEDAWADYLATRSLPDRNRLVLCYASLVRYVASKVSVGLPSMIDRDDLVSYGTFGLMDAIAKFDPTKGVKFETYAITRIKGNIIDELRKQDRVPRSVRSRARALDQVTVELETELGHRPDDAELAQRLGVPVAELWMMQSDAAVGVVVPLDEHSGGDDDRPSLSDIISDVGSNPEDLYVYPEIAELLARAIATMSERSRTILALYYMQEMTLAEIGEILGVTESRVCQLQGKLLEALREALTHGLAGTIAA